MKPERGAELRVLYDAFTKAKIVGPRVGETPNGATVVGLEIDDDDTKPVADWIEAALTAAPEALAEVDRLRDLLRRWEERVTCLRCGQRYSAPPCREDHAAVYALVMGQE